MNRENILHYLKGELEERESQEVIKWLSEPANEIKARELLGELWTAQSMHFTAGKPDFEQLLKRINDTIIIEQDELNLHIAGRKSSFFTGIYPALKKIAAVLFIPLLIASLFLYRENLKERPEAVLAENTIFTKPGSIFHTVLPDGTSVWLNDGTTLKYPETFEGTERQVYLDGEAYFEVKADPEHPFIINNAFMKTEVTGTRFNISAYQEDRFFELTLQEGKVSLLNGNNELCLKPGEQVRYEKESNRLSMRKVNPLLYSSWIDGKLMFEDETLGIALKKLGRWYNVRFTLDDESLNELLITATFRDEKLSQIMQYISFVLPVDMRLEEQVTDHQSQQFIYVSARTK